MARTPTQGAAWKHASDRVAQFFYKDGVLGMDRLSFCGADLPHVPAPEALLQQLHCYAQDLREVMSQKSRLMQRYQQLLHFMGRHDTGDDLLLNAVLQQMKLYLVTNAQGEILYASSAMERQLGIHGADLNWRAIDSLMPAGYKAAVRQVLDTLGREARHQTIQQRRFLFVECSGACDAAEYDALVLRVGSGVRTEIFWLFKPSMQDAQTCLERQKGFPLFGAGAQALMMTDSSANICAINDAFTVVTGFSRADAVGGNPRILNSGLQDPEFYQQLWKQLLEVGGWSGEIFNRRKNGQIFFEWINIRKVQDAQGETVSFLAAFSDLSHHENSTQGSTMLTVRDAFTGLTNMRLLDSYFDQMIAKAKRNHSGFAVLHLTGGFSDGTDDAVLLEFCRRVRHAVRVDDVVVRVGQDDYVVLLPNEGSEETVRSVISFLLYSLDAPIHSVSGSGYADPSVGAARFPADGEDKMILLDRSEAAMVRAMGSPARYCFWK